MYLGRVVGRVWATAKNASLEGQRMLVIQPLTPELRTTGKPLICLDSTGAGAGEIIYWVRGREASIALLPAEPPADTTVVGIVDTIHLRTAPGLVEAGATGAESGPARAEAEPRGAQTRETGAESGPAGVEAGPRGAQSGPARVEAGLRGAQTGETGAQSSPDGVPAATNGTQAAPKDPAAPGASRTPTHRKGRRC
jgi:ethanolamine utilization protein EutN